MTRRNILKPKNCLTIGIKTTAVLLGCVVILASQSQQNCHAQGVFDWTNTTSSNSFWDISGNWTPGGPPGSADTASFLLNASYKVSFDDLTIGVSPDVGFIDILDGNVTFSNEQSSPLAFTVNEQLTLSGGTTNLTLDGLNLSVGTSTNILNGANLTIDGSATSGTSFSSASTNLGEGQLIFQSGTQGTLGGPVQINVNKADAATMRISSLSQVTSGDIEIGNGASQSASSSGSLIVNGPGATLTMNPGATLEIGNTDNLGSHQVSVDSNGLLDLGAGGLTVNRSGGISVNSGGQLNSTGSWVLDGGLNINSGGSIISGNVTTALASTSNTLNVTGTGSQWTTGDLVVGRFGISTLNLNSGGALNTSSARLGQGDDDDFARGTLNISGAGSAWNNAGNLTLGAGDNSDGILTASDGALVTTDRLSIFGDFSRVTIQDAGTRLEVANDINGSNGRLIVENEGFVSAATASLRGNGSTIQTGGQLAITDTLEIGRGGISILSGGQVSSGFVRMANGPSLIGGAGSQLNTTDPGGLVVGEGGSATLTVESGGQVSTDLLRIGAISGSGTVTVRGTGSQITNTGNARIGTGLQGPVGMLNIESGGVVTNAGAQLGQNSGSRGIVTVSGTGSQWNNVGELRVGQGGEGNLTVENGGQVTNASALIGNSNDGSISAVTVTGTNSNWNNSSFLSIGNGELNVEAGGQVTNTQGVIAFGSIATGSASVTGAGSRWDNSTELIVGKSGDGTLNVDDGGVVTNSLATIGDNSTGVGVANITGIGSQWTNDSQIRVGNLGSGSLNIEDGGFVSNALARIGANDGSNGEVNVTGSGSRWLNSDMLVVGDLGSGILNIESGGLVTVGERTTINSQSAVNLSGGRFEFGTTTHDDLTRINATGGSMAGTINISGINDVATFTALQNPLVDLTDVNLNNSGLLVGSAITGSSLNNQASGELMTSAGQQAIFAGSLNNAGEVNNTGGTVRFEKSVANQAGAFVGGRGVFGAGEGWTNEGVMAFSGTTDILGDVNNLAGGQIVTSGGATTTLFDDLVHNGTEIRTSAGSNTVIFGEASGAGAYTGIGTVFFEGDLRPGNSPGIVDFEGSVVFGDSLFSEFELGGIQMGQYDRLNIDQDLFLGGQLAVTLFDDFELGLNQEFLIADVGGDRLGFFNGLNEGSLVGNFGGRSLFITYNAGRTGNGVALFTPVPEPGSIGLLGLIGIGLVVRRRKRSMLRR